MVQLQIGEKRGFSNRFTKTTDLSPASYIACEYSKPDGFEGCKDWKRRPHRNIHTFDGSRMAITCQSRGEVFHNRNPRNAAFDLMRMIQTTYENFAKDRRSEIFNIWITSPSEIYVGLQD